MRKVVWNRLAISQFRKAIEFIRSKSYQNAEAVSAVILDKISNLPTAPESHPPDKYKIDNDGRYRAFEIFHFRISYYITSTEIIIIRIRHTSMSPKNY